MTKARTLADLLDSSGDVKLSRLDNTSSDLVDDTSPSLGGDLSTNGNDVNFGDNDKAQFGADNDLQIYHDGGGSIIKDTGTGDLRVGSDAVLRLMNAGLTETTANFNSDGAVELFHNNSKKLETTSTGVDVTGNVVSDGLTVDGQSRFNDYINFGGTISTPQTAAAIYRPADNTLAISTANTEALRVTSTGDVQLKGNSGSISHAFNYNENGGEIALYDDSGNVATLIDQANNNTRLLELQNGSNIVLGLGSNNTTGSVILNRAGYAEGYRLKNNGVHEWKPSTFGGWTVFETDKVWTFQKQFNSTASNTTWNLMRIKRFYWGHGFYKFNVQENYYHPVREADFYVDGHTRDGASYSPDVHIDAHQKQGNMGNVITRTTPSNSSPGSADQAYTDIQLTLGAYLRVVVTITVHKDAVSWFSSSTSMPSTNCFALL